MYTYFVGVFSPTLFSTTEPLKPLLTLEIRIFVYLKCIRDMISNTSRRCCLIPNVKYFGNINICLLFVHFLTIYNRQSKECQLHSPISILSLPSILLGTPLLNLKKVLSVSMYLTNIYKSNYVYIYRCIFINVCAHICA